MRRWLSSIVAVATALAIAAPDGLRGEEATRAPAPIHTRQGFFSIPFRLDAPADASKAPTEVHLYVSANAGGQWQLAGRATPQQNSFNFKAPHDGDYWFVIRTVDSAGRVSGDTANSAPLRVTVDTVPPRIDMTAVRGASGEIRVRWQAVDPNLRGDSLKLEYKAGAATNWRAVAVDNSSAGSGRSTRTGEATWWPDETGVLTIRAEINDRAGNPAVSQATIEAGAGRSDPVAGVSPSGAGASGAVAGPAATGTAAVAPPAFAGLPNFNTSRTSTGRSESDSPSAAGSRWAPNHATDDTLGQAVAGGPALTSPSADPEDRATRRNLSPSEAIARTESVARGDGMPRSGGSPSQYRPRVEQQYIAAENASTSSGPPEGERPVMVKTRTPVWNYDVTSTGPSGVAKVEIWGTRDGGKTWSSYGIDPDNRSPIQVSLPGEGLFGFRLTVQNGNGLGSPPPQAGDLPEAWVFVDLTRPEARFVGAEPGEGDQSGSLVLRWEASDQAMTARPVTLSFSATSGGPWTTIASGLENTGSYVWQLDSRIPDRVFMRMEVRDEAGNVTIVEPIEPIAIDRARPRGRILNLSPSEDSARMPRRTIVR